VGDQALDAIANAFGPVTGRLVRHLLPAESAGPRNADYVLGRMSLGAYQFAIEGAFIQAAATGALGSMLGVGAGNGASLTGLMGSTPGQVSGLGTTPALGLTSGSAQRGVATVFMHDTGHVSVLTEVGGETLHTHQVFVGPERAGLRVWTQIAEVDQGAAPIINSRQFPLSNGPGAIQYQRSVLGQASGVYRKGTNSCLMHCAAVLRAGGVEGVPSDPGDLAIFFFGQ
jgi:hypothetical protein